MNSSADRRQFWRAVFRSPVFLVDQRGSFAAELMDVSLKGALVKVPPEWQGRTGDNCQIKIKLAEGAAIVMQGYVAHAAGRRVGIYCERIDIDSMTHLRRLVELNAGDPALLDRELAALVGTE